jgi:hypothetical protein
VLGRRGSAAGSTGYCAWARGTSAHALLCRRRLAQLGNKVHVVVQLYSPRTVELDFLQRLAHYIVRLVLCLLGGLDDGRLVEVALIVDVELAEGVLQAKDLALLELGVLSARNWCQSPWNLGDLRGSLPLQLDNVHGYGDVWGTEVGRRADIKTVAEANTAKLLPGSASFCVARSTFVVSLSCLVSALMTRWGHCQDGHGWAAASRGRQTEYAGANVIRTSIHTSTLWYGCAEYVGSKRTQAVHCMCRRMLSAGLLLFHSDVIFDSRCRDAACKRKTPSAGACPLGALPAHTMDSDVEMRGGWSSTTSLLIPVNGTSVASSLLDAGLDHAGLRREAVRERHGDKDISLGNSTGGLE